MALKIKLWGVRGSLPTPHPPDVIEQRLRETLLEFLKQGNRQPEHIDAFLAAQPREKCSGFGGNTACVEVSTSRGSIVIDGGSGIRMLGEKLMLGPCGQGQGEVDLFFTHFHWDHLIGLPFFVPLFVPGNKIRLHAVQEELEMCVRAMFKKPFFPVPFEELRSTITFHQIKPRVKMQIAGMSLTPYQLDHPDPCWGYRIEAGGKAYAHCVDTECTRVSREELGEDLALYKNADLALFDAQYTLIEAIEKTNWGHASAPVGLEIALREGVKQILFAHHDPGAADEKIADAAKQTQEYLETYRDSAKLSGLQLPMISWEFAREGQEIDL